LAYTFAQNCWNKGPVLLVTKFLNLNKKCSLFLERRLGFFPQKSSLIDNLPFKESVSVADIGGGKKPFLTKEDVDRYQVRYTGIDIDPDELALAPKDVYDDIRVIDIELADNSMQYDLIICRYTLEHVTNSERAIAGLMAMLKEGGECYISLPSRYAIFGWINRVIPQAPKKMLLGKIYPSKITDGFPAFYDKASPREFREIISRNGGMVVAIERVYFSGYFTFLLPLHIVWRLISFIQMAMCDDYCERFEMVFTKTRSPAAASSQKMSKIDY
jgi:SAM-dependent methyltransferase